MCIAAVVQSFPLRLMHCQMVLGLVLKNLQAMVHNTEFTCINSCFFFLCLQVFIMDILKWIQLTIPMASRWLEAGFVCLLLARLSVINVAVIHFFHFLGGCKKCFPFLISRQCFSRLAGRSGLFFFFNSYLVAMEPKEARTNTVSLEVLTAKPLLVPTVAHGTMHCVPSE